MTRIKITDEAARLARDIPPPTSCISLGYQPGTAPPRVGVNTIFTH
jgi:hypothetical protein